MFKTLFSLEWKSLMRSANLGKSIAIRVLFLFFFLYMALSLAALSASAFFIFKEQFPNDDPLTKFSSFLIYYYAIEFLIRFMLQNIPIVKLKPLLIQNITKNSIVHFLLTKSIFSIFNLLPFLAFTPFAVALSFNDYEISNVLIWWFNAVLISFILNFLNLFLQKTFLKSNWGLFSIMLPISIIALLQYFKIIDIPKILGNLISTIVSDPLYTVVLLIVLLALYALNFYQYKNDLYIESKYTKNEETVNSMNYKWLDFFGSQQIFIQNELRLLWRNKRLKGNIFLALGMLFYGLFFFGIQRPDDTETYRIGTYLFIGFIISGMFSLNYGQMLPAWDSSAYGFWFSQGISGEKYLQSKVTFMIVAILIISPFIFLYYFLDPAILYPFFIGALSNIGISIPFMLLLSITNYKKVELDRSPMMNYQGVGWQQYVGMMVILFFTIALFGILALLFSINTGLNTLLIINIINILFLPKYIKWVAKKYKQVKYKRIEGFQK